MYEHLVNYRDAIKDILHCLDYAMKELSAHCRFVITCLDSGITTGSVSVNGTGMSSCIPENILDYVLIATSFQFVDWLN